MADAATQLPRADWTRRGDLAALVAAFAPGALRWVGGAVRDTLIGEPVHDIDASTPFEPVEVIARLDGAGIRSIPTGLAHGTLTAIMPGGNVEITTLRSDVATDGRHAEVAFSSDWREDAARRDFTINALYADPGSLEVHDYFGGLADLAARRVRFIGDAGQRIREDHLRILRYYRFEARFGPENGEALDLAAEDACASLAPMLKGLSRERVGWELQNLLALPDPQPTIARMFERGVLPVVLPETGADEVAALAHLIAAERAAGIAPQALRRLAALVPPDALVADKLAARLRLSGTQRKHLVALAERRAGGGDPRALAYRIGRETAIDWQLLTGGDIGPLSEWDIPVLPLKGGEIVARGIAAGPEVARILQAIERRWIAEGFPPRARVEALLEAELGP